MAVPTLVLSGAVHLVAAVSFAAVARAIGRVPSEGDAARARRAFVAWWAALGTYMALQGSLTVLAGLGGLAPETYLASRALAVPLLCLSVWGLTSYVTFLYTGRWAWSRGWAAFYLAVAALFAYVTFTAPRALHVERWTVEGAAGSGALLALVYVAVGLPPILGSVAYLSLWPRLSSDAQRWRVVLVAGSILLWVGSGLAARVAGGDASKFVTLVGFGLGAAAAVALAYYPPAWAKAKLHNGLRGLPVAPSLPASAREERRRTFQARIRDLV